MDQYETLPIVPLRDVVVFPHMMLPFTIGRPSSTRALEHALATDKKIFLAAQHDASVDDRVDFSAGELEHFRGVLGRLAKPYRNNGGTLAFGGTVSIPSKLTFPSGGNGLVLLPGGDVDYAAKGSAFVRAAVRESTLRESAALVKGGSFVDAESLLDRALVAFGSDADIEREVAGIRPQASAQRTKVVDDLFAGGRVAFAAAVTQLHPKLTEGDRAQLLARQLTQVGGGLDVLQQVHVDLKFQWLRATTCRAKSANKPVCCNPLRSKAFRACPSKSSAYCREA